MTPLSTKDPPPSAPHPDTLPISALQHLLFCERQCALIHLERLWEENQYTAEGRVLHEKVDGGRGESRPGIRITRSLQLRSDTLGIHGVADIVELHRQPDGRWQPFPVEYKRGKPKGHDADRVQLCAQALCLEETLQVAVPHGALFYGQNRHRHDVAFDDTLRAITLATIRRLHQLIDSRLTPRARKEKKCAACSLLDICLPESMHRDTHEWNHRAFNDTLLTP